MKRIKLYTQFNESKSILDNNIVSNIITYYESIYFDDITYDSYRDSKDSTVITNLWRFTYDKSHYNLKLDTKYIKKREENIKLYINDDLVFYFGDDLKILKKLLCETFIRYKSFIDRLLYEYILETDNKISNIGNEDEMVFLLYERFEEFDVIQHGDIDILKLTSLLDFYNIEINENELIELREDVKINYLKKIN